MDIILRFFRNTQAISLVALLALLFVLRIPVFFIDLPFVEAPTMPLTALIFDIIPKQAWLYKLLSLLMIAFQAIYFNKIMVSQHIIDRNSFFPAFFYVLFSSMIPTMHMLHPALFANSFLLLALQKTHGLYQLKKAQFRIFDAGFYIGLAILCFLPSLWYVSLLIIGLTSYQIAGFRYHIISLLGVLCPIYLWSVWVFFQSDPSLIFESFFIAVFSHPYSFVWGDLYHLSVYVPFLAIAILAMRDLSLYIKQKDIKARKAFQLNYIYLAFSVLTLFSLPTIDLKNCFFLIIPIAGIVANYYLNIKKSKLAALLLFLLFVGIFFLQWYA